MSVAETVLVFLGIPLALYLLIAGAVYGLSGRQTRYRPGRPFAFEPVWFVAARAHHLDDPTAPALPPVDIARALPAGSPDPADAPTTTGGARGTW